MSTVDRESAFTLLQEHAKGDTLIKHGLAVEAAMRAYARHFGEDEGLWGVVGLLHDFDWDVCPSPEQHPTYGADILRQRGYPENIVRAVLSHGNHTGVPRESLMEHALFAVDELSGFVTAVALVRPSKSLEDTTAQSVRRKMKDKAFARAVNREDIVQGAQEIGVDLDQHISVVIDALKPVAAALGLNPG
ncbi:MAG: HDIG domain-containing protein [Chloroflexi bacterium]|nr:HDIG domain-containing protein [Chloroflexota bacterium]